MCQSVSAGILFSGPAWIEVLAQNYQRPDRADAEACEDTAARTIHAICGAIEVPAGIGNLFATCNEPDSDNQLAPDDFVAALVALIGVGALQQVV